MNGHDAELFLEFCGVETNSIASYGGWVRSPCPLAPWLHDSGKDSHPSFAIKINDSGESFFNCFACRSGDCLYLLELLSGFGAKAPRYNIKQAREVLFREDANEIHPSIPDHPDDNYDIESIPVWPEEWLDSFVAAHKAPAAVAYLAARNVSPITAAKLDIRFDSGIGAVCFPVRDWSGELVGLRGRRINPGNAPRYHMYSYMGNKSSLPWLGESWIDTSRTLVMVESVFDLAAVYPVYSNVCAPLTVSMSEEKVRRMGTAISVVTLFDNGAGGDKARDRVSKYFKGKGVLHLYPPDHRGDPGEMTKEEIENLLAPSVYL